ncbi:MAG: hypothetical protein QW750_06290 [Zestosphaera sp.]
MQTTTIKLPEELIGTAYKLGEGNVSMGIRKAIDAYLKNPTDPRPYRLPAMRVVSFKIETEKMNELFRHAAKRKTTVSALIRHQLLQMMKEEVGKARVVSITRLK